MFKTLFQVLKQKRLMEQALERTQSMLEDSERLTRAALAALIDKRKPDFDIYALDRELNRGEVEIRQMILKHLAVQTSTDINPAMALTSTIIDVERIGDYAKNLYEVSLAFPEPFAGSPYTERARAVVDTVLEMFDDTQRALREDNDKLARDVMSGHARQGKECESIIADMARDDGISSRQAILVTLTVRFVKRISAHLSNLASSVVNTPDRIGFKPGDGPPEDADL